MITIKDVAKRAKVSPSTVSLVLNNKTKQARISDKTRHHVLATMKEMDYVPSLYARHINHKSTYTLGIIVRDIMHPVTALIAEGIKDEATKNKFQVILGVSSANPEQERDYINNFLSRRVDGLIVIPVASGENIAELEKLHSQRFPVVICKEHYFAQANSVVYDVEAGSYTATKYLLKLGHRRIATAYGSLSEPSSRAKFNGYCWALQEAGVTITDELQLLKNNSHKADMGIHIGRVILDMDDKPDAVLFVNDEMASQAMNVLMDAGIRVPDDISLIGFDGIISEYSFRIPLTTIRSPLHRVGQTAVKVLMKSIKASTKEGNEDKEHLQPVSVRLIPELVIRKTTSSKK